MNNMTPIVMHHGLFGHANWQFGPLKWMYYRGIDRAVAARGYPVILPGVHPTASVGQRAGELKGMILRRLTEMNCRDERIVILAHSMGGLDARYMLTHLGMAERTAALVTVCTPHRGSHYADWCVKHLGQKLGGLQLMNFLKLNVQGILDVTTEGCRKFNAATPDMPGVKYYSVSAERPNDQMPPFAKHSNEIIRLAEGPNDGLVSMTSAQWGEHLGTWTCDHWLATNRRLVSKAGPSGRIVGYWMEILDRLVKDGALPQAAEKVAGRK